MDSRKLYTILTAILCVCIALFTLKLFWFFADTKSDKIYKQGLEFYNKQDYQNAYYNFKKISLFSTYSIPALYRQATCAWELRDIKTGIKKYAKFARIYKGTDLAPEAIWRIALLELEEGNVKKANACFSKLVEKYPESDFAHAAFYKLGLYYLEHNQRTKAKNYFIDYIEYAPLGRYALNTLSALQNYTSEELTVSDKVYIAKAYYENGKYNKSLEVLSELPFEDAWITLVYNYDKLADTASFSNAVLKGVSLDYRGQKFDEKEILEIMNLYIKKSGLPAKSAAYNLVLNTKKNPMYPLSLFLYSKYVDSQSANRNYEKIYNNYPDSIVSSDALWMAFWYKYKNGDDLGALKLSKLYTGMYNDYNIQPKIMYWSAKIHLKLKHRKIARSTLHNIVYNFPNSYYAFRANALLKKNKNPFGMNTNIKIDAPASFDELPLGADTKEYRLLNKFITLGDYQVVQNFKLDNQFLNSWIAAVNGRKSYSALLARDALKNEKHEPYLSSKYKLAYPVYYADTINKNSIYRNIDPYLMLALIREESFFDEKTQSATGARGLMQLMPATARLMDNSLYDDNKLYNPEYNIYLGVKYFEYLMKIFNGNPALCVLAYNSGPGAVQKWLDTLLGDDFDEFVENIPYPETANYIKKVYASYWVYLNVYGKV